MTKQTQTQDTVQEFVVGGAIRDTLLKRAVKDIDWVIVGATPQWMLDAGFQQVGADFPVFLDDNGQEFALARTERKTSAGYHGFETDFNPDVTLSDDLFRRDLTVNAMAVNKTDWEEFQRTRNPELVIDPFNGKQDLEAGVLRHVSDAFVEDPLRVLRVARFAARYNFTIDPETLDLMTDLARSGELNELTPERIWQEFEKALMEDFPINFFRVLNAVEADELLFPGLVSGMDRPLMVIESLDRCVLLEADFNSRLIVLCAGLDAQVVRDMLEALKAPKTAVMLATVSCTVINMMLDHSIEFDTADDFTNVLDAVHAWSLPGAFIKVMQTLVNFDNDFIRTESFVFLKAFRAGSKVNFSMLTIEQQSTLQGKEISAAIAELRRSVLRELLG